MCCWRNLLMDPTAPRWSLGTLPFFFYDQGEAVACDAIFCVACDAIFCVACDAVSLDVHFACAGSCKVCQCSWSVAGAGTVHASWCKVCVSFLGVCRARAPYTYFTQICYVANTFAPCTGLWTGGVGVITSCMRTERITCYALLYVHVHLRHT